MFNNHITIFVEMSDEDKLLEQNFILQRRDVNNKINIAIQQNAPYVDLTDLEHKLHCSIRDLKGGVYADKGQRMPRNSQELAQEILKKAQKVASLELDFINERLNNLRNELHSIKSRIEDIISFSIEHELDKKFDDFSFVIKCWGHEKSDVFDNPERCAPAFGLNNPPMIANNLIGYYIKKLRAIQSMIGELNLQIKNGTQVHSLISICEIVMSCTDDNLIFDQIFLMGQYAGNLNNIKLNIDAQMAKECAQKNASSKSDWTHELAQVVYLNYWVYGKAPTANEVEREFPNLVLNRSTTTISNQLTKQRKYYSNIDNRVLPVNSKGRNKKV